MQPIFFTKNRNLLHYAMNRLFFTLKIDFLFHISKMDKNKCPIFLSDPNSFLEKNELLDCYDKYKKSCVVIRFARVTVFKINEYKNA
jgi:hypothetical protein